MKDLTKRQQEILQFIQSFREANGYPPTLREIGKHFGISSTFGVKRHLDALVKKNYLNIESNASRGISFLKDEHASVFEKNDLFTKIPVIGRVAAGSPILAEENREGSLVIDPSFLKSNENCFALKVRGDSMINAGIFDGDLVIVSRDINAKNKDIVVAMIDNEATVKTFYRENDKVILMPENEKYKPIEVTDKNEFSLIGKVKGIIRYIN